MWPATYWSQRMLGWSVGLSFTKIGQDLPSLGLSLQLYLTFNTDFLKPTSNAWNTPYSFSMWSLYKCILFSLAKTQTHLVYICVNCCLPRKGLMTTRRDSSVYLAGLCRSPVSPRGWAQSKTIQGAEEDRLLTLAELCISKTDVVPRSGGFG